MILPKQKGTPDSCVAMNEEEIFDYQDQHNLITIGWIHVSVLWNIYVLGILYNYLTYQSDVFVSNNLILSFTIVTIFIFHNCNFYGTFNVIMYVVSE